jgi:Ni,Fe-hydrogenase I small subunit
MNQLVTIWKCGCGPPETVQNLEKEKYKGESVSIKSADIPVNPCMRCVWRGMQSRVAEAPFFCLWE